MHSEDLFPYSNSQSCSVSLPPLGTTCMPNVMRTQEFLSQSSAQHAMKLNGNEESESSLKSTTCLLPSSPQQVSLLVLQS